jgi:tetratricopeptide (TPR) repeat protein/tRNA A-37 threonylcarbamoyl transferase component Bud32
MSREHLQNGRYTILKNLGEGGKGVVYKVRDTILNRVVAIKMLKSAVTAGEGYSRFIREAQATAKLNHPNIVSIYDIGQEDETQFFVIEFVPGMDLHDLVKTSPDGRCDIQTTLRIGIDVCKALQYAHAHGVLHRDIKPENILVTDESIAKLMDFGLARMLDQPGITEEGTIVGTTAYVAPEIALGKGADTRSDLYSFGAVLYEMVTGNPPFPGEDPVKIIFSHIHDYPVSPDKINPEIPPALTECIMNLLEKDPQKRFKSATHVLNVLKDIAESSEREVLVPSPSKPVAPVSAPSTVKEVRLINRGEEMDFLRDAVDKAVRGEGQVIFLCGEAGIGKTRLAQEAGTYARLRGMQVLSGRSPALFTTNSTPPYTLWKEVIDHYLEKCTPEQLYRVIGFYPSEVSKLIPELKHMLGTIPQSLPISAENERDRLFEAVSQVIINISKETPLLVILDDLQWADQSSFLLLHYLACCVHKESLLLMSAYRDTDVDENHPLVSVLTELNRERLLQSVSLNRLSFEDGSKMIQQILGQKDVPTDFCTHVYEKTRGNPFFVEEVMESLMEDDVIYWDKDRWKIKKTQIEFPETVKSVIKKRISRLDQECQHVLTMASFIGKDFTFEVLREITDCEEDELLDLMETILKTGLIKEKVIRGEDVYSFADIIMRDVVQEEVSRLRYKKLHNIVGNAIEKVYAETRDQHFRELALHFLEGGNKEKALSYFLKAAEESLKVYANNEAASSLQSALDLLEAHELERKGHIIENLGDIKKRVGDHDACMTHWNNALLLFDQLHEKETLSRLHRKIANLFWDEIGDTKRAQQHYEKALEILEPAPGGSELARLYEDMAHMYYRIGDMAQALSWAEKARDHAETQNDFEVIVNSYASLGTVISLTGDKKKGHEYLEKALKIALDNTYTESALRVYTNMPESLPAEENERTLEYLEKGYELAKRVGHIVFQSWIGGRLAERYLKMGNTSKALLFAEESEALDRKVGHMPHLSTSVGILGFVYLVLGEWEKSESYCREAVAISENINNIDSIIYSNGVFGLFHYVKGDYTKAKEFFEKAFELFEKAGEELTRMDVSQFLVWTYMELEEIEKATNLIDRLHRFSLEVQDKELMGTVDMLRGMQFCVQKKWEESIEHFKKGYQQLKSLNAQRWNVYIFATCLYEYAGVYLKRNSEGDREKAHTLLNEALELFQKMGAKKDIERIIAKKNLLTA